MRISWYIFLIFIAFNISLFSQNAEREYQYALIEAVKQKNLGNIPGAIELYKMVLNANDSVAVAHYELGSLLLLVGKDDEAMYHLETAYQSDYANPWYYQSYIDGLMHTGAYNKAINIINKIISVKGAKPEYFFQRADIYFRKGKTRKAIKQLVYIEKHYGYSDKITMLKANIFESKGKYKKALQEVTKILKMFPESIEFKIIAAELATKLKDDDLAADYYVEVLSLDSLNIYALTNLTDYFRKEGDLGKSFYYMNNSFLSDEIEYDRKMAIISYYLSDEEIVNNYDHYLLQLLKTLMKEYPERKEAFLFATDFYIQNHNYNKALNALINTLDENEKNYEVWRQGILLANATKKHDTLLNLINSAIPIFPDSTELYFYKAISAFELKRDKEVIKAISDIDISSLRNQSQREQLYILEAEAYQRIGIHTKSDSLFRKIIKENANNYFVMNNFAYYLSIRGESLEEAQELSMRTIQKDSTNYVYLDTYAWILFKMGNLKDAKEYIIRAIQYGGNIDPDVLTHAGDIYAGLGLVNKAKEFYIKADEAGAEEQEIEKRINNLE